MKTVKIKRDELLDHLRKNREAHVVEFKEAWENYVKEAIAEMKHNLKVAQKEGKINRSIDLVVPVSYSESYDRAITMLEWTQDEIVELDQNEFEQYVRDNWQWKQIFGATASLYNSKVAH
jgi:hypothetical protein